MYFSVWVSFDGIMIYGLIIPMMPTVITVPGAITGTAIGHGIVLTTLIVIK